MRMKVAVRWELRKNDLKVIKAMIAWSERSRVGFDIIRRKRMRYLVPYGLSYSLAEVLKEDSFINQLRKRLKTAHGIQAEICIKLDRGDYIPIEEYALLLEKRVTKLKIDVRTSLVSFNQTIEQRLAE